MGLFLRELLLSGCDWRAVKWALRVRLFEMARSLGATEGAKRLKLRKKSLYVISPLNEGYCG